MAKPAKAKAELARKAAKAVKKAAKAGEELVICAEAPPPLSG
jgi:hypothetical protein